jgi:hypothetical protein
VLFCVQVEDLWRADPPCKESCRLFSPSSPFLLSSSFLLLYIPLYLIPSFSDSKLQFVCLRWLILMVEGEVRVWLTSSDLGRMRFLPQGRSAGPQLRWGREKLGALSTGDIYWCNLQILSKHTCTIGVYGYCI